MAILARQTVGMHDKKAVNTRRGILAVITPALALCLCAAAAFASLAPARLEQSRAAMGTEFTVVVYAADERAGQEALDRAFDEIQRIDRAWSDYKPDSELSRVNRHAACEPVAVDGELFRMLETCFAYSRETGGAFDITVGPLLDVWGFFKGNGRLPSAEAIAAARRAVGWDKVRLDGARHTVWFGQPGMRLDLGAIGKGYAIDRAAAVLHAANIGAALITAGTSSIVAVGAPPHKQGWTVNIRDPKDAHRVVATVILKDKSLSTSGNYEKFFRAQGKIYSHIFDPRTGYPAERTFSVSVVASTGTQTDALSTSFFVMGKSATKAYLKHHRDVSAFMCHESGCGWIR